LYGLPKLAAFPAAFFCAEMVLPRAFAQNDAALRYLETRLYGFVGFSFGHKQEIFNIQIPISNKYPTT